MNEHSSRSHAIFMVTVESCAVTPTDADADADADAAARSSIVVRPRNP